MPDAPTRRRLSVLVSTAGLLAACGGGGGDAPAPALPPSASATPAPAPAPVLAAMVDSFGRSVPEAEFGTNDPHAAGVDGTAAEGRALAGALIRLVDVQGRVVSTRTDAQGYFRLRVDGLQAPFVAAVIRPDGSGWHAPVPGPVKERGFLTVNVTPLTDKLASDVARASRRSGAPLLQPSDIAAHAADLAAARASLATDIGTDLGRAGIAAAGFDPVSFPFRADGTGLDAVLDRVSAARDATGATVLVRKQAVSVDVLVTPRQPLDKPMVADLGGLVLSDGVQELPLTAMRAVPASFPYYQGDFTTQRWQASSYRVSIVRQPAKALCWVNGADARVAGIGGPVASVVCDPDPQPAYVGVTGLAGKGLRLQVAGDVIDVTEAAVALDRFGRAATTQRYPLGAIVSVSVVGNPPGLDCRLGNLGSWSSVVDGSLYDGGVPPVASVTCASGFYPVAGRIDGPHATDLVLRQRWYAGDRRALLTVPPGASRFEFEGQRPPGGAYEVSIERQPLDEDCTVPDPTGTLAADTGSRLVVRCASAPAGAARRIEGEARFPEFSEFYDYVELEAAGQRVQAWIADSVSWTTPFQFAQRLAPGTAYEVKVVRSPIYYHGPYIRGEMACEVTEGARGVAGAGAPRVVVNCR